ncbi:UNVERIFIED_CONTAM: hypothetical protein RKD43_001580 [Streptomyces graminofaciens]
MTVVLATITARRAGTAAKVVRIRPLVYSPKTAMAPTLPATTIRSCQAGSTNAVPSGSNSISGFSGMPGGGAVGAAGCCDSRSALDQAAFALIPTTAGALQPRIQ